MDPICGVEHLRDPGLHCALGPGHDGPHSCGGRGDRTLYWSARQRLPQSGPANGSSHGGAAVAPGDGSLADALAYASDLLSGPDPARWAEWRRGRRG